MRTQEGPIQEDLKDLTRLITHFIILCGVVALVFAITTSWKWHTHDLLNAKVDFLLTESMKIHTHDEAGP